MCRFTKGSRAKVYKFLRMNIWGRLFFMRKFRGKGIIFSGINRRLTSRRIRLNALKLRRKKPSLRGLGIFATFRFKRFYFGLSNFQLKSKIIASRKLPFFRLGAKYKVPVRVEDKFVSLLELRLDNILQRSGIATSQTAKFLLAHRKVLVNDKVITKPSFLLNPGDIVTFDKSVREGLFKRNVSKNIALKFRLSRRLFKKAKNKRVIAPLLLPFMVLNKLVYLSLSYTTCRIIVGNAPRFASQVYYPFKSDIKHLVLNFNNI